MTDRWKVALVTHSLAAAVGFWAAPREMLDITVKQSGVFTTDTMHKLVGHSPSKRRRRHSSRLRNDKRKKTSRAISRCRCGLSAIRRLELWRSSQTPELARVQMGGGGGGASGQATPPFRLCPTPTVDRATQRTIYWSSGCVVSALSSAGSQSTLPSILRFARGP
jgi:hypothetical protein